MNLDALQAELVRRAGRYQVSICCDLVDGRAVWWCCVERIPPEGPRNVPTHLHLSQPCASLQEALTDLNGRLPK